jgi:subtilisin family serine protease
MRFRRSFVAAASLVLVVLGEEGAARADVTGPALVRLLEHGDRPHPLADAAGKVAFTAALPAGAKAEAFGLLPVAPGFGAIHLEPSEVEAFTLAHPGLSLRVTPRLSALLDRSKRWTKVETFRQQTGTDGTGVVVGIVDTGIDITHPDFRDENGKTRIKWLMHSAAPTTDCHRDAPTDVCLEDKFGCRDPKQSPCEILDSNDIDAMIASKKIDAQIRDFDGHGTHVTSIAAGNGGPIAGTPKYVGMAPHAALVVAAPSLPGFGFGDADVLNSARFVFDRADALGMPCALNLSIGGDFGPHDGSSALEEGLAAMVGDDKPGHAIVVAAGNSGSLYVDPTDNDGPFGVHTEAHVSANGVTRVPIRTFDAAKGQLYVWITFRPGDQVSVGLEGPHGSSWIGLTDPGNEGGYDKNGTTAAVINNVVDDKSELTSNTNGAVVAVDGSWDTGSTFAIRLEGHGDAELWISGQGDAASASFERALRQGTISVPATHPKLLAVGCSVNRIDWQPLEGAPIGLTSLGPDSPPVDDSVCYFSSAGPTPFGVMKPEILAPGAFVAAAMSVDADPRVTPGGLFDSGVCPDKSPCYVVDNHHAIGVGTSMSAPHVTGAAALLFEANPNLTQAEITDILQAGARYPTGIVRHQTQLGPGALDLEGARAAMAKEPLTGTDPDVTKSWYVLSSEYARPDPTWPVWGTIELRHADGSIASGLDGTFLSVVVKRGVMVQPLSKIRQGMWQFAFSAPNGSGGTDLEVEVRYRGQLIGEARTLPIGTDEWQAGGAIAAEGGGCACGLAERSQTPAGATFVTGLALLGIARRRRRRASRLPAAPE